ncbi:MAG: peptidoglycan DD-metalloendopeptidase family protein [Candidatus Poseidoniaceae archaeon]|jgi:murein DD-endopeptidase MepM/ murein hydrolase activator NlpD|nr:peptidoglycan DD-metalloendopeptidase family protein [Candidatus Poseidoniaceae archaeon]
MAEVVRLPPEYWVFDFTRGEDPDFECPYEYSIGRYDEHRPGMYTQELFQGTRNLHIGIDIGGPVGEPIYAFASGVVHSMGINDEPGSYGPTIITKHQLEGRDIWALHGHLSLESLNLVEVGQSISEGQMIASIGNSEVNGGWSPHLHFQLCWEEPKSNDMPGVVSIEDRKLALEKYPDPRIVLGPIY